MGVLAGVVIVVGKGSLGVNLGRPTVTNGAFATRLFSNYSGDLLFISYTPNFVTAAIEMYVIV